MGDAINTARVLVRKESQAMLDRWATQNCDGELLSEGMAFSIDRVEKVYGFDSEEKLHKFIVAVYTIFVYDAELI